MSIKIKYSESSSFMEVTYTGTIRSNEFYDAFFVLNLLMNKKGINMYLADCLKLKSGYYIPDMIELINTMNEIKEIRTMKGAIIQPLDSAAVKDVKFFEDACVNRGFNVKIFDTREKAVSWLTEKRK